MEQWKKRQEINSVSKNQGGGIQIGQGLKKIGTIPSVEIGKGFLGRKITCKKYGNMRK